MDDPSDEDLMLEAIRGDRLAIATLVEQYYSSLFRYVYRLTGGDRSVAEDLLQDTFSRLLTPRTYRPGRPVKPWLYAFATNLVRDRFRLLAREGSVLISGVCSANVRDDGGILRGVDLDRVLKPEQLQTPYIERFKSQPRAPRQAAAAIAGDCSENALAEEATQRLERLNRLRSGGARSS